MRIAALAFGVLAGLVASLILALGGLDVAAATPADRTAQAIRFFLVVVGNIGFFGAALTLAFPLAGAILLVAGALAWVGAALLLSASNLVLITPPLLLLFAAIPAFIAHFRNPRDAAPEPEILAPLRPSRPVQDDDESFDDEPAVEMPNFGEPPPRRGPTFSDAPRNRASAFSAAADDRPRDHRDWNPRKKRPVPPRARPAFRRPDVDDDEDGSVFSRFALSASSILSFGLYAALAGAALLVVWTLRGPDPETAVATAEAPTLSTAPASSEPVLSPVLPAATTTTLPPPSQVRTVGDRPSAAAGAGAGAAAAAVGGAGTTATASTAELAPADGDDEFGEVVMSDNPLMPPRLEETTGLPFDENAVAGEAPAAQPVDLVADAPPAAPPSPVAPTVGPMMPYTMTPQMAALRTAAATGPTIVAMPTTTPTELMSPSGDAGL